MQSSQTSVVVPALPAGAGRDPTTESDPRLDVVAIDLVSSIFSVDEAFTLSGPNLGSLETVIDGYSRFLR